MAELETFDQFGIGVAQESWALFRRDPAMFIIAAVVMLLGSAISLGLIAGPLHVGYIELCRRARRGEPISVGIVFSRFDAFIPSLIAFLIVGTVAMIGFFLLVVPGLVVVVFAAFTAHAITYENVGGIDAIRRSIDLVRANIAQTLVLLVGIAVLQALGGAIVFGVLLSSPLALIALTIGYERITGLAPAPVAMAGSTTF